MKQLTFLELAKKVLEEEGKPLSAEEIWELATARGHDKEVATRGKTPARTLGSRIYVDIRDTKNSPFIKWNLRPTRFYLHSLMKDGDSAKLISNAPLPQANKLSYLERELHPFLAYFAHFYLKAYTKTISHSKSGKKEFGEWVHPDMIGCYFPIDDWRPEVFEFSSLVGSVALKLYSFEIKRELSFANLRESFFQSVSNSSWANEAYLVAAKISQDEDFLNELRRLSTSFGIGVISLSLSDPDSSEILFPANNREYLDWDMMNKLTTMNDDFKAFLKRIRNDIATKEIQKKLYDEVLTKERLIENLKSKKID